MNKIMYLVNAVLAYPLQYFSRDKNVWLLGGHAGELYQDNAKALYKYINENEKDRQVYWVVEKGAKCIDEISKDGKYIFKGSIKNYILFYRSSAALFSHSLSSDIAPFVYMLPFARSRYDKVLKVFLAHGIDGFKKKIIVKKNMEKLKEKIFKGYDMYISVGEFEKNIKVEDWRVKEEKILVSGFARYDALNYKTYKKQNKILYMPTWRSWIDGENIMESDYYKNITGLLQDENLINGLKSGIILNVYIHHLMQKHMKEMNMKLPENVHMLDPNADLQKEIIESSMLVTDYSSVAWDFYYMDKPVLFFHFDQKRYEEEVGSYIDLDSGIFGPKASNIEECVREMKKAVENGFAFDEKYEHLKKRYFKYQDGNNCRRIVDAVKNSLEKREER